MASSPDAWHEARKSLRHLRMSDAPRFSRTIPPGEDRERLVCLRCGFVEYENPKVVVGVVATWGDRVLLCRRAIEPRRGAWTLPAGFLEQHESPEEGAIREAWEEARATLRIRDLLAVYTIKHISQVQLLYRAELLTAEVAPGPESLEVGLFTLDALPADIAFPSVRWALEHHAQASASAGPWTPRTNPIVDPRG
jgi:ADP-ribose pyrophosphatase YjhB (NUDIX family)